MHKRYGLAFCRLVFGFAALVAIVTQFVLGLKYNNLVPVNFFSYFTIESNILAAFVFMVMGSAGILGITLKKRTLFRGAAVLYMVITGIVYASLLSGLDVDLGVTAPWINVILHYIMPIAVLLDWFIDPPDNHIPFKSALIWTTFPLLYLIYSLVRGEITNWYPYPFLNPATNGYVGVAVTAVGILIASIGLIWLISHAAGRGREK